MDKYNIRINRLKVKEDKKKAYNQCKDNENSFLDYKKDERTVFPKKDQLEPYEKDLKRKKIINKILKQIQKNEEDSTKKKKLPIFE